jgi:thiol-disulfide isomerase/thioredoxin
VLFGVQELKPRASEMADNDPTPRLNRTALATTLGAAGIAAIAGFASVYVTVGRPDNAVRPTAAAPAPPQAEPKSAAPAGPGANPLSRGEMAAFVFRQTPEALPEAKFQDATGVERTLESWRGKVVLLNLWATWCLPCRKEMPALDRLQRDLGSDRFEVVAVSVDRTGLQGARKFLDETKVEKLALYADGTARMGSALRAAGLPVTILIDREGREVGRLLGPAEWDSEDAKRLIRSVLQ